METNGKVLNSLQQMLMFKFELLFLERCDLNTYFDFRNFPFLTLGNTKKLFIPLLLLLAASIYALFLSHNSLQFFSFVRFVLLFCLQFLTLLCWSIANFYVGGVLEKSCNYVFVFVFVTDYV